MKKSNKVKKNRNKDRNRGEKQDIDHREFIVEKMNDYIWVGLNKYQNLPNVYNNGSEGASSVVDWARYIAMNFIICCGKHINKQLTEKYFTEDGIEYSALLDDLGQNGNTIGASAFRIIDLLIFKLSPNNNSELLEVYETEGNSLLRTFVLYLFRDDQSISEHCEYLSEEISHKCKLNEGDNSPLLAEFLLSLIGSNSDSLELSLSVLQAILQGRSVKQRLTESIQMHESYKRLGCFDEKGLEGYILLLNLILDEVTRLDIN